MPKFRVAVTWVSFDRERFLTDYRKVVDDAFIKAARKFLLAAVPRVPVLTGMARSGFRNLEDIAGRVSGGRIRGTLKGARNKKPLTNKKYYYYPPTGNRILRTPTSGVSFGTDKDKILVRTGTGSRLRFTFNIDITYIDKNEPIWEAFSTGREAFNEELNIQLKRLPELGKYLVRREIK